jgi:predicted alpha/beta-fold hydrolase
VRESGDLLAATDWLRHAHGATRVGLVCFSLTGYESLLTAWLDGKNAAEQFVDVKLLQELPAHRERPAFDGGMFIVSAPVGIMDVGESFSHRSTVWNGPVKASFEDRVAKRLEEYGDTPGFSMWDLSRAEIARSGLLAGYKDFEAARPDFLRFIDLSADNWKVGAARMENVRVPLLVLSAANDPLASGQSVAELFSRQRNPNIGVVLLKEGGHMGFSALSADYYYSLMVNFFDPRTGPRMK